MSGPLPTPLSDKFRNYPLVGLPDGSLDRAVAKAEALEENNSTQALATARCPVPGTDYCHQLVDKVVDVIVSMQQLVAPVQIVQRHSGSSTDQVVQRTLKMRHIQFIDRAVDIPVVYQGQVLTGAFRGTGC